MIAYNGLANGRLVIKRQLAIDLAQIISLSIAIFRALQSQQNAYAIWVII